MFILGKHQSNEMGSCFFRVFVMFVVYQIMGMKSDSNQWDIHGVVFGLSYPVHRCICELNIMEIGECTEAGMEPMMRI